MGKQEVSVEDNIQFTSRFSFFQYLNDP